MRNKHFFKAKPNDTPFLSHYKQPSLKRIELINGLEIVNNQPNSENATTNKEPEIDEVHAAKPLEIQPENKPNEED